MAMAAQGVASPASRNPLPRVMPASYYGMEEAARGGDLLRDVALDMQNGERESLGLAPLVWDSALAEDAARYARQMAQTNLFRHSTRTDRAIPSGENLWMGPRRLYGYDRMIGAFLDEKRVFRRDGKLPDISVTGRWEDAGHYSQIIWRGTRKVGCALGEGQDYDYLVCRYYPAGNVFGQGPLDAEQSLLASSNDMMPHRPISPPASGRGSETYERSELVAAGWAGVTLRKPTP